MGTDNLFHKRKAKKLASFTRRAAKRAPYAKILIVCEGERTETNYFNEIVEHYALNSANVEVCGDCGSDPGSILKYAKQRFREENDRGDGFDHVYCVFDRDSHTNYIETVTAIQKLRYFHAITSVPCFEYWLLLHFTRSTQPFHATPNKSAGAAVLAELKKYMPDYTKAQQSVFTRLLDQLEFAKQNAKHVLKDVSARGDDNPSTYVHELVHFMQGIKVQ